jgi:hypothetical protein
MSSPTVEAQTRQVVFNSNNFEEDLKFWIVKRKKRTEHGPRLKYQRI